jgi:hypothetical protein
MASSLALFSENGTPLLQEEKINDWADVECYLGVIGSYKDMIFVRKNVSKNNYIPFSAGGK